MSALMALSAWYWKPCVLLSIVTVNPVAGPSHVLHTLLKHSVEALLDRLRLQQYKLIILVDANNIST